MFQNDPHWRDLLLFHEYFHGDNGAGHRRQPPDGLDRHACAAAVPRCRAGARPAQPRRWRHGRWAAERGRRDERASPAHDLRGEHGRLARATRRGRADAR